MATLFSVGSLRDPHILKVHEFIQAEGVEAVLIPAWTDEPSRFAPLTWSLEVGWSFPAQCAFWLRNKHRVEAVTSPAKQDEWWSLKSTTEFLRAAADQSRLSFNSSKKPSATDSKIAQLELARACGFHVPATLVSNDRAQILAFVSEIGDCIIKPLSGAGVPAILDDPRTARHLPTTRVRPEDIRSADPASFAVAPSIYQRTVEKTFELRVVAFGDEIVCFRLDSQSRRFTRLDWRAGERLIECARVEPPSEIVAPIQAFLTSSGLHTSVFDFAVTPDGQTVFFESNPAGQWARMDSFHDFPVSRMFARQMAGAIHGLGSEVRQPKAAAA